jgi:vitamin-K-epoxide reductase (warfarin-sensitive)
MMSKLGLVEKGSALDVPNAAYGVVFYICAMLHWKLAFLSKKVRSTLMMLASLLSCASSIWLAYALYFELHDACLVCISTYVVNIFIFVASTQSLLHSFESDRQKQD